MNQWNENNSKIIGWLLTITGIFCLIVWIATLSSPKVSTELKVFLVLGSAFFVWFGIFCIKESKKYKEREERFMAETEEKKRKQFYEKCKSERVTSLSSPINRQKAELIAKALGINVSSSGLEKLFSETQEKYGAEERRRQEDRIRDKRQEERREEEAYSHYARFSGRDKRVAMLTDRLNTIRQAIQTNDPSRFNMLYSASQQKEHDWAFWGGLASGAAGGAAGLATALDLQAKNAGIRAQNQANATAFAEFSIALMQKKKELERDASSYESELLNAKIKLVSDVPESDIMEKMSFNNVKVNIQGETGTFKVKAHVAVTKPIERIEGRSTVIDGTICANLIQDGRNVGSAKLVLPLYGIKKEADLEGMCCGSADAGKPYSVEFSPYKLWIMEE